MLSHEHQDHTKGAPRFARKYGIPVFSTEGTYYSLNRHILKKVDWLRLKAGQSFKLDRLIIDVFPTPHDAREPVSFRFRRGRFGFSHVTDIGYVSQPVEDGLLGSQVVLIESNHDIEMLKRGPYPETLKRRVGSRYGHLSNEALARYLEDRLPDTVRHVFLAHLSQTNNHESLAMESARAALRRRGGKPPNLVVTYQDRPTRILRLNATRQVAVNESQGVLAF